jgi:hypothetical protein
VANGKIELADDEVEFLCKALREKAALSNRVENEAEYKMAWQLHDWISAAPRVALVGLTLETARNI